MGDTEILAPGLRRKTGLGFMMLMSPLYEKIQKAVGCVDWELIRDVCTEPAHEKR